MKLFRACACYLLSFSAFMVIGALVLRYYASMHGSMNEGHDDTKHLAIDLQEFVFCNVDALANFERKKKKERSIWLNNYVA